MWSKCGCWNVLEVKNKIKEGGIEIGVDTGHLRGGEKQEKEKRKKKEMKHVWMKMKWKKNNNIKNKKS